MHSQRRTTGCPTCSPFLPALAGDYSLSNKLTYNFIDTWKKSNSGAVVVRELIKTTLPFVDVPWMGGAYTPAEQHSPEMKKAIAISDELIAELKAADHIVIATPMYNFAVPAILKAWIDHIVRINVTFTPQYEGLLKNKKATVIVASGGEYTPGSGREAYNAETPYLKSLLGFLGITDVEFILAGGVSAMATGAVTLEDLVNKYTPAVEAAAK